MATKAKQKASAVDEQDEQVSEQVSKSVDKVISIVAEGTACKD